MCTQMHSSASLFKTLVLAVALVLAVCLPVLADVQLLPAWGRVFIELETVCTRSANVAVRSVTITGDVKLDSPYPFYVERLYSNALVRTVVKSPSVMYVAADNGDCKEVTNGIASDGNVLLWNLLRELLTNIYTDSMVKEDIAYRGIPSRVSQATATLTIPTMIGGSGTSRSFTVEYLTNTKDVWLNYQRHITDSPLTVNLIGGAEETCSLTFSYFGSNVTSNEDLEDAWGCDSAVRLETRGRRQGVRSHQVGAARERRRQPVAAVAPAALATSPRRAEALSVSGEEESSPAFPVLPDEFSANFQVLAPRQKAVYFMRNSFSIFDQVCYTTLQGIHPDVVGRVSTYEWYLRGRSQLAYYLENKRILDSTQLIDPNVQEYFWPDVVTCDRALMGYDLFAYSGANLLLVDNDVTPMFVGNRTVRGIPCGVWSAPVNGARVTWYFASNPDSYERVFPGIGDASGSSSDDTPPSAASYGILTRVTVEGYGTAAPFFVHHPFFAQPYAFPKSERWPACFELTPDFSPEGCRGMPEDTFYFTYDVTSFVPYVPFADDSVPMECSGAATSSAFPSATCSFRGGIPGGAAAVLMILVAILFVFLGLCCMWCRFAPMVRGLQEDMVMLVEELQRRDEEDARAREEGEGKPAGAEETTTSVAHI